MNVDELFEPITIGTLSLKNRISMAPMHSKYASESGEVTEKLIGYFAARARGGAGLLVVENTCVDWEYGKGDGNPVTIHDDRFRPRLNELVDAVHRCGAKIIPELHHVGRQTFASNLGGRQPVAPSPIKSTVGGDAPREITEEEIWKTIDNFRQAARRAKECGFDGVELHGAHGYLFSGFISPRTNHRKDKWGGSFENRVRFALEVIKAVREDVGSEFPLFFRFSAEESAEDGLKLEEGVRYAQELERAGVDCLDVSHGNYESLKHFPMQGDPLDQLIYLSEAVKMAVNVPVIAVGSLGIDPEVAAGAIRDGKADIVHFGRELLADPALPNKLRSGKFEEARKCIRCGECNGSIDRGHSLKCAVNPECGFEYKNVFSGKREKRRGDGERVVVAGGGPSGLEYAVTAAGLGARVTLLEKREKIGGLANECGTVPYKRSEIAGMLHYYRAMLRKYGVDLHLNTEATYEEIMGYSPDRVVLAAGWEPVRLEFPGDGSCAAAVDLIAGEDTGVAGGDLLPGSAGAGSTGCVIGGSGVGLDAALFLKEKGYEVKILEMSDSVGSELSPMLRWRVLERCEADGVEILTSHRVVRVEKNCVVAQTGDETKEISCDFCLSAVGFTRKVLTDLETKMRDNGVEVVIPGEVYSGGHFMDAIHAGFWLAADHDITAGPRQCAAPPGQPFAVFIKRN